MNSNLKLLPAALLVAVLALAGCGGGGGGGTTDTQVPDEAPSTPECMDGYALDQSTNECVETAANADAEDQAEADAKAAKAAAETLYKVLGSASDVTFETGNAAPAGFNADDAIKSSQSITLEGDLFSENRTAGAATLTDGLAGFYPVQTLADAKSSTFGGISLATHTGNASDGDRNHFVTSGMYLGISGTLRCAPQDGGSCTSQDGNPVGGEWHFKPNDPMARVAGDKIQWGWWLTVNGDDEVTRVNRFHAGAATDILPSQALGGLGAGTASYEGDATGQYAVIGDSGAFEAKASLQATFGEDAIPLSGTIHTFTGADGESRDWMVELEKESADANGALTNGATVWSGSEVTNGWNATMYNGTADKAPNVILGNFNAATQGGRMTGVFGTELQE